MKRPWVVGTFAALTLSACTQTSVTQEEWLVAPNTVECHSGQPKCLVFKPFVNGQPADPWRVFYDSPSGLNGFEHQPGYRYRLLVDKTRTVPSGAFFQGDPPPPTYALKQVLEKTPDSTIAVPGQP